MTVDLWYAQYLCTSHAYGAVKLSKRHSKSERGNENGDYWEINHGTATCVRLTDFTAGPSEP